MLKSPQRSNWQGTLLWISMIVLAFFFQSGIAQGSSKGQLAMFSDGSHNHITAKLTAQRPW